MSEGTEPRPAEDWSHPHDRPLRRFVVNNRAPRNPNARPALSLTPSRHEVLARLHAVPLTRNLPKPHASRERNPHCAAASRVGLEPFGVGPAPGVKSQAESKD